MRKVIFAKTIMLAITSTLLFSQPSIAAEKVQAEGDVNAVQKESQPLSQKEKMVNINKASSKELVKKLDGIGESKANAIVAYRSSNGDFKKIDDLLKVKGIGKTTLEKNRHLISL